MSTSELPASFQKLEFDELRRLAAEYLRVPVTPDVMLACSRELIRRSHTGDAKALLQRLLETNPVCEEAHALLGRIFDAIGALADSARVWRGLVRLDPGNAAAWGRLGAALSELGEWDEARDAFDSAIALDPKQPQFLVGLAMALIARGLSSELSAVRDDLLARFPELPYSHLVDGHVNKIHGQKDLAIAAYQRALGRDPTLSTAMFNLVELETPAIDSELFGRMHSLRGGQLNFRDRSNICFALARTYDKAGRFEEALGCYREGNDAAVAMMKHRGVRYDPAIETVKVARIIGAFPRESLAHPLDRLPLDLTLIFIVGLPRSGTTLVEQILACHSQVGPGGELPMMQQCVAEFHRRRAGDPPGPVDVLDARDKALLADLREHYLDGLFERELDAKYVTDKMPANFNCLGLIRLLFPEAVIVHCQRDPLAVCWSLYSNQFGMHEPYYNSFEGLAHYHALYCRLMDHWRDVLTPPVIECSYENLICRPELAIHNLITQCGLEWEPACLNFHTLQRPVFTASQVQVRRPLHATSVTQWRNYEKFLGPLKSMLATAEPSG